MPSFVPKPMYKTDLASAYGVSIEVFNTWVSKFPEELKTKLGNISGKTMLTITQVTLICEHLTYPF